MDELGKQVFELARLGLCPKDIEETLGLPAYKIHETYHHELMHGYLEADNSGSMDALGDKNPRESHKISAQRYLEDSNARRRARLEDYRLEHQNQYSEAQTMVQAPVNPKRKVSKKDKERERRRKYYLANKEKIIAQARAYRAEHREKEAERKRRYYEKHKEYMRAYMRAYRKKNLEKIKERDRIWYHANKEKVAEQKRKYREANQEKTAERNRRYREANKEKLNEQNRLYGRRYREANREKIREYQRLYREANREKIREQHLRSIHRKRLQESNDEQKAA